jgi:hypothetical protein
MPTTLSGRELINQYLKDNHITITSIAAMYGKGKMYVTQVLSGEKQNPAANALILRIIEDFKIRPKEVSHNDTNTNS